MKLDIPCARDVEAGSGSFSVEAGSGSRSAKILPLLHRGGRKEIGSVILRRRANRGSINIKK